MGCQVCHNTAISVLSDIALVFGPALRVLLAENARVALVAVSKLGLYRARLKYHSQVARIFQAS